MRPPLPALARRLTLAALVTCLALPAPARPADLRATSRVDAVTVYRAWARVTRLARVELPAGDSRVLLTGLPPGLDDESIRVEGKGTARARVFGVTAEPFTAAEAAAPEVRAAEDRVEALEADDRALDDRVAAARARGKFAESLRASYSEERAKNLAVRGVSAREWADLLGFVDGQLAGAAAEVRKAEAGKRDLARRLAAARADLEKLNAKRGETTKVVAVEVSAERAGSLEVAVSYLVGSASWQPTYDARLLPEAGQVELTFLGTVSQQTGEDWAEARLTLSTAEPSRGLWVPELESLWLQKAPPPRPVRSPMPMAAAPAELKRDKAVEQLAEADAVAREEVALEAPVAEVAQGLLAATFTAPRRETVDGAGRARTVTLARYTLAAQVSRTAAPRVDPAAYLTATVQNDTGVPLLPGLARVSVGDELVGRAPLDATPPGGELKLAFGADGRVEVERRVVERRHETAGLISKEDVIRYRVRTTVKNRYAAATVVRLLDLVPVSRDEAIKVKVLDGTTPATREDPERPGVRVTEVKLGPKAEQVLELRYEVRFPRGMVVQGLE
ncbi:MAG: mucoidy inhibitor MuiA family protein [Anaeromyxobacter sp.]|nr:mucoidy inhibitor MuiA family protein [Anaeromyxobacter sp.]